jgi:hydroxypyruvate isomerase
VTWQFSACIEMLFRDLPVTQRIEGTAAAACPAYEFWGWRNKDLHLLAADSSRVDIRCAGLVGSGGIPLVDPDRRDAFLAELTDSIAAARIVGAPTLIITTGQALPERERAYQHESIVAGLRAAAPIALDGDVRLVLEPLNTRVDHAGYYLDTTSEGVAILEQVGSPAVTMLFDAYHAAVMGEDIDAEVRQHVSRIGHIHIADAPGRHEPGTGNVDYRRFFRTLDDIAYAGFVGMEFRPSGDHATAIRTTMELRGR